MAQINKPTDYFNTLLYTGDGNSSQAITGVGFQPDLVWLKNRSDSTWHQLIDAVRGTGSANTLASNSNEGEGGGATNLYGFISAIGSDGFTVSAGTSNASVVNHSGNNYASWNWLGANASSSNTDGSITSSVSANTTSGFSIVSWSGSGATGTIGHGLGTEPSVIIPKCRTQTADWYSYWKPLGNGNAVRLNTTDASASTGIWNNTSPTSSVFSVINNAVINQSGHTYVAYCFAEKKGFSKFGSYVGNNSTDGTFVYTGFKPAFVIYKKSSASGTDWVMVDNKRPGYNVNNKELYANLSASEGTVDLLDFTSNGFKCRRSHTSQNESGQTYIYMCFAENPLTGTNGVPCTAR